MDDEMNQDKIVKSEGSMIDEKLDNENTIIEVSNEQATTTTTSEADNRETELSEDLHVSNDGSTSVNETISTGDNVLSCEEASQYIGCKVIKEFPPYGIFKGTVKSYEESYFNILYEDGDGEDIDLKELLRILLPSVEDVILDPIAVEHLKHPFWADEPDGSEERAATYVGRFVCKNFFRHGLFHGKVSQVVKPYFKITYEDGDEEEIDIEELNSILVPITEKIDLESPYIDFDRWLGCRKQTWSMQRNISKKRAQAPPICEGISCACKRAKYSSQMNWPVERLDVLGKVLSTYCSATTAEKIHSLNPTSVLNACLGHIAQTGGHRFAFQEVRLRAYERLKAMADYEGGHLEYLYDDLLETNQLNNKHNSHPNDDDITLLENRRSLKHGYVWWHAGTRMWIAKIYTNVPDLMEYHVGSFDTEEEAILGYQNAEKVLSSSRENDDDEYSTEACGAQKSSECIYSIKEESSGTIHRDEPTNPDLIYKEENQISDCHDNNTHAQDALLNHRLLIDSRFFPHREKLSS